MVVFEVPVTGIGDFLKPLRVVGGYLCRAFYPPRQAKKAVLFDVVDEALDLQVVIFRHGLHEPSEMNAYIYLPSN